MPLIKRLTVLSLLLLLVLSGLSYAKAEKLGGDFALTDQHGNSFNLQQLRGKVVLLFFGYTFCPDVCPAELSHVSMVLNRLGEDADKVSGVFVSIDPERDSPEVLKSYVGYFNEELIGLTGSLDEIDKVARQYRIKYQKQGDSTDRYTMDHSASLYVINQQGELTTVVPYGLPVEHVLRVVRYLLDENS